MNVSVCTHRPILSPCGLTNFDYQVDPYIGCGHYCYYCYALATAETDWSEEIRIHEDIVGQLSTELATIPPQKIYLGYHTDPYQPCEAEYRQTRKVLKLFVEKGFSASILTKSDLVIRDIELLSAMDDANVSVSVAFNDTATRSLFEANTMETGKRIEALHQIKAAGVRTGALLCPVVPYITDVFPLIDLLEPCTDVIWIYGLSIADRSGENWKHLEAILKAHFPESAAKIEAVLFATDHPYWDELREDLEALQTNRQLNLNIHV